MTFPRTSRSLIKRSIETIEGHETRFERRSAKRARFFVRRTRRRCTAAITQAAAAQSLSGFLIPRILFAGRVRSRRVFVLGGKALYAEMRLIINESVRPGVCFSLSLSLSLCFSRCLAAVATHRCRKHEIFPSANVKVRQCALFAAFLRRGVKNRDRAILSANSRVLLRLAYGCEHFSQSDWKSESRRVDRSLPSSARAVELSK